MVVEGVRRYGVIVVSHTSADGTEKLCAGPGHDEPTWLPATEKYFYRYRRGERIGKLSARCRLCSNWDRLKSPGLSGYVEREKVLPFFTEAVNRVGIVECSRRTGIDRNTLRHILSGENIRKDRDKPWRFVQKRTVRKLMLELISMRRKGEVRHRDSIASGGVRFGKVERRVRTRRDLYKRHGDDYTEARNKLRQGAE